MPGRGCARAGPRPGTGVPTGAGWASRAGWRRAGPGGGPFRAETRATWALGGAGGLEAGRRAARAVGQNGGLFGRAGLPGAGGGLGRRVCQGGAGASRAAADPAKKLAACVGFPPVSQGDRARDSRHAYIRKFRLPGAENWWIRADFGPKDCAIHQVAIPGEKSDVCVTAAGGASRRARKGAPHEDTDFRHRD